MTASGPRSRGTEAVYHPFGRETWRDPFSLYRRLRDEDPVHRSPHGFCVLTRFSDVYDAARDTATFSSAQGLTFTNEREKLGLYVDPTSSARHRAI